VHQPIRGGGAGRAAGGGRDQAESEAQAHRSGAT
jgi:hypothetical protein